MRKHDNVGNIADKVLTELKSTAVIVTRKYASESFTVADESTGAVICDVKVTSTITAEFWDGTKFIVENKEMFPALIQYIRDDIMFPSNKSNRRNWSKVIVQDFWANATALDKGVVIS